ncbi:MAG: hypothetical protein HoeaKO_36790 [Hoeflea alexandrii]
MAKAERKKTIWPAGMPSPEALIRVDMVTNTETEATLSRIPIIGDPDCPAGGCAGAACGVVGVGCSVTWCIFPGAKVDKVDSARQNDVQRRT